MHGLLHITKLKGKENAIRYKKNFNTNFIILVLNLTLKFKQQQLNWQDQASALQTKCLI